MEWLAIHSKNAARAARLRAAADATLAKVDAENSLFATVSHIVYPPLSSLIFGGTAQTARRAAVAGRATLEGFEARGVRYKLGKDKVDYARGNNSNFSNGLTSNGIQRALEYAAFSGDRELISAALKQLRVLDAYTNDVPRGAQWWEVPLHSPDILASASLVNCYTLGYELTGDKQMLERARYWAWTGVPFIYLTPPTKGKVGLYSTIAVFGATTWIGSWFGRPVQWNGLVYSDALRRLADHDTSGPWKKIADGITISGMQQVWPTSDTKRQGLLPDFFILNPQIGDGPAINPATVQANAVPLFTDTRLYYFRALRTAGLLVHAPGAIAVESERTGGATLTVKGWPNKPYYVLLSGLPSGKTTRVLANGRELPSGDIENLSEEGRVIVRVRGTTKLEVALR
jgi:hypothetical protein